MTAQHEQNVSVLWMYRQGEPSDSVRIRLHRVRLCGARRHRRRPQRRIQGRSNAAYRVQR